GGQRNHRAALWLRSPGGGAVPRRERPPRARRPRPAHAPALLRRRDHRPGLSPFAGAGAGGARARRRGRPRPGRARRRPPRHVGRSRRHGRRARRRERARVRAGAAPHPVAEPAPRPVPRRAPRGAPASPLAGAQPLARLPAGARPRPPRGGLVAALAQDYVRPARARGLGEPAVIGRHALRVAIVPVLTYLGPATAGLVTGSVV